MTEPVKEYEPIEFFGHVHYDDGGQLQHISVSVRGHSPVRDYVEIGDSVGDMFERAYEAAKTLLLTERYNFPQPADLAVGDTSAALDLEQIEDSAR